MHGVFAAQLTIGNTSFHKLFSVSRDPYNVTRASGLRMLVDIGEGWRAAGRALRLRNGPLRLPLDLLARARPITISAIVSGDDPAMQWRVTSKASPAAF